MRIVSGLTLLGLALCALVGVLSLAGGASQRAPAVTTGPAAVLGRRVGDRAVGIAVRPAGRNAAVTVTVEGPDGPDAHAAVTVTGRRATGCGLGRYCATVAAAPRLAVRVGKTTVTVAPPRDPRPARAMALVTAAVRALRAQRSLVVRERLDDGAGGVLDTVYRMVAPHRLAYTTNGGGQAIIVGGTRWDRTGPRARWQRASQDPVDVPAPDWRRAVSPTLLHSGRTASVVSFADPTIPAWFEVTLDRRTGLPLHERMTAASHFMDRRYGRFGAALTVMPPRAPVR